MTANSQTRHFLRQHIPKFKCVPGCHDCCGPVTATSEEMFRLPVKSAAEPTDAIGQVRLQMDAETALVRLFKAQSQSVVAQRHCAKARTIAVVIEKSLESSGLDARLGMH